MNANAQSLVEASELFSIIIIPDTQMLSKEHPAHFLRMTQWIADHAHALNLKMVLHVGDVVHNGAQEEDQFITAKSALDIIDQAQIPMLIVPGNHDYDNMVSVDRSLTLFNTYFGVQRLQDKNWFGGVFAEDQAENSYALLEVGGKKLLYMGLEFGPRDEVLAWADHILEKHVDYEATIITHCYMYMYGDRNKPGDKHNPKVYPGAIGANDGEDLWEKCLRKHRNVAAVYSGHQVPENVSYRMDLGDQQNLVFQSFQNWQSEPGGGEGRIRIVQFDASNHEVKVRVMNPLTEHDETHPGYQLHYPTKTNPKWKEQWPTINHP